MTKKSIEEEAKADLEVLREYARAKLRDTAPGTTIGVCQHIRIHSHDFGWRVEEMCLDCGHNWAKYDIGVQR